MLVLTIVSLEFRLRPKNSYVITKTLETLLQARNLTAEFNVSNSDPGSLFNQLSPNQTRSNVLTYILSDFTALMFPSGNQSSILQQLGYQTVGVVRFHTVRFPFIQTHRSTRTR